MPDPQTPNKFLNTPAHNADIDTWDVPLNQNFTRTDAALGTYTPLNANGLSGTVALTTSQAIPLGFIVQGTPSGTLNYQLPAGVGGLWLVRNQATLGASITISFSSASGGSTVTIPAGKNLAISADGTSNGMADIDTVPTSVAGGSNTQIQVNVGGVLGGYAGFTFDGSTFHTPELTVDGNAVLGTGAGSTMTVNGTAISAPNGFNFNAGAFEMNAGGMLGIGTTPTSALLTIGGLLSITSGGTKWPNGLTQTTSQVLQIVRVPVTATGSFAGTYSATSGAAPTSAGGAVMTPFSTTFTPVSASSILEIDVQIKGTDAASADQFILALFNGSTLIDYTTQFIFAGTGQMAAINFTTWVASPGTSAQSLSLRIGANSGTAFLLNTTNNGSGGTPQLGMISWLSIKEFLAG